MATDSTLEDTDASPDEGREETSARGTPSPPRPPRPGKRSKGSGRIPIPLPQSRPDFEAIDSDAPDRAPPVNVDERAEPAFPLVAARSKPPPSMPEESFADIDADLADHAPNAPVTPWRGTRAVSADASGATPPRGTPLHMPYDDEARSDPEPTLVGKVPDNLFELAGAGDENTRAFTAPRELIELAKRKREERLHGASASAEEHAATTARPQALKASIGADADVRAPAAPSISADRPPASEDGADAAPPVARSHASAIEPASRPAQPSNDAAPESGPEIEIDPASELSPSARRAVFASTGRNLPVSEPAASTKRVLPRHWLLLFALFVLVGVVIARWREIAALFR